MEFSQFIKNPALFLEHSELSVLLFQGTSYSHTFFMQFFDRIKNSLSLDFKIIDMQQAGDFAYKSQLETSFLGMQCLYWLGDISGLKAKQKDDLLKYISNYQGPHKIIVFADVKVQLKQSKFITLVMMKDKYFFDDAKNLWATQDFEQAQKTAIYLQQLYKIKNSFSLDELFLLKNYQDFMTTDAKEFFESWVTRLVLPDASLFTLSQFLFEKKEDAFFKLWFSMQSLYSEIFWISFWSDQVYRSYFFIAFIQKENFAAVKQVSFGLSFSFMKQTYKNYQLTELQNFHQAIFMVDTALKNGGNVYQIDQLYIDFFAHKFKS